MPDTRLLFQSNRSFTARRKLKEITQYLILLRLSKLLLPSSLRGPTALPQQYIECVFLMIISVFRLRPQVSLHTQRFRQGSGVRSDDFRLSNFIPIGPSNPYFKTPVSRVRQSLEIRTEVSVMTHVARKSLDASMMRKRTARLSPTDGGNVFTAQSECRFEYARDLQAVCSVLL